MQERVATANFVSIVKIVIRTLSLNILLTVVSVFQSNIQLLCKITFIDSAYNFVFKEC